VQDFWKGVKSQMQRQRLFAALIVVLVIVGLVLFIRKGKEEEGEVGEGEGVRIEDVVSELSTQLGVTVPEDVERISLSDVSGGAATGLATRKVEDGRFIHTVLAALPDLSAGTFYEGWLVRGAEGDEDYSILSTGKLRISKGGYLLEFSSSQDLSDHPKVVVTLESVDDGKPETHILEGKF
jgi:hypothetical protein